MNRLILQAIYDNMTACMPETEHRPLNPLVDTFTIAEATDTSSEPLTVK